MKRWIFSFLVFPVALSVGLAANYVTNLRQARIQYCPASSSSVATIDEPTILTGFQPEFTSLPNAADAEFPEWNERFIDTYRFNNVFRESEVVAKSGQTWLALFERKEKYELVKVTANVRKLNTITWPGDERDVRLTFDKPGTAIFAVRSFKSVRPGEIVTLYLQPSWEEVDRRGLNLPDMKDGYSKDFHLDDKRHRLRVSKGVTLDGERQAVLLLETDSESQVVHSQFFEENAPIGNLLWAGDLDRDGKLDLYFEPFSEKGGFGAFLFLSSEAEAGRLVKNVSAFGLAGC